MRFFFLNIWFGIYRLEEIQRRKRGKERKIREGKEERKGKIREGKEERKGK